MSEIDQTAMDTVQALQRAGAPMVDLESAACKDNLASCQELVVGLREHAHQVMNELLLLQDKAA